MGGVGFEPLGVAHTAKDMINACFHHSGDKTWLPLRVWTGMISILSMSLCHCRVLCTSATCPSELFGFSSSPLRRTLQSILKRGRGVHKGFLSVLH